MKIEPIYPKTPYFTATCCRCGARVTSETGGADLEGEAFKSYYCAGCASLRAVKVHYSNGDSITTDMASGLADSDILEYFAIGREFNLGVVDDLMATVTGVEILR